MEEKAELLEVPVDRYNVIWMLCSLLGVAQLFPWNAFISASDYFNLLYKPFPFAFALPIAFNWGNMLSFLALTRWGGNFSEKGRLYLSFGVTFSILFITPIINMWEWDKNARIYITLFLDLIAGIFIAIMTGTSFSITAVLPAQYTGSIMAGQGVAGVFAGILKICVNFWWFPRLATNNSDMMTSGMLYFGIASLVMILVVFSTWYLTNTRFYEYYLSESRASVVSTEEIFSISESMAMQPVKITSVLRKIWLEAFHVCLIFILTLTLFPGFTTRIRNYDQANISDANFVVILISIFQLFDVVGRVLPKWVQYPKTFKYLPILIWVRFVIFVPLFMLSIYTDLLPHNSIPCIVMAFFAISNGYFSTLCMMYGPVNVSPAEVKTAGTLMAFFLQFGVFLGVHFAMLLLFLVDLS